MHFGVLWIPYTAFSFLSNQLKGMRNCSRKTMMMRPLSCTCAGLAKSTHVPPAKVYTYTVRACMYGY